MKVTKLHPLTAIDWTLLDFFHVLLLVVEWRWQTLAATSHPGNEYGTFLKTWIWIMLKTCSLFITCHYQIYVPLLKELNPLGMFQDFAGQEARLHFCVMTVAQNNSGRCSEEGLWNISPFFWTEVNVWIYGHKPIFSSIWTLLICFFYWCFTSFKHPSSCVHEEKDYFIQSDRFPCWFFLYFFYFLPLHSTFLPHFCLLTKFCLPRLYLEL